MKRLLCVLFLLSSAVVKAQTAEEKAWLEYMSPGPMHQLLAKYTGTWNQEISVWMNEGAAPQKMTITSTNSMILGGRYLERKQAGDMGGTPYEGVEIIAYDNAAQKFISTSYDNLGTSMLRMKGQWDMPTRTITFNGEMTDPVKKAVVKIRSVMKFVDADHILIQQYDKKGDEPEKRSSEIKLSRKK
jgi:hypothetical protein